MPMIQMQNLTLAFSSESSIQEELKRESTADAITILVSLPSILNLFSSVINLFQEVCCSLIGLTIQS